MDMRHDFYFFLLKSDVFPSNDLIIEKVKKKFA